MTAIRIELKGGTMGLSASGDLYISPVSTASRPVVANVVVRATQTWSADLEPEVYVYRYRLQNGAGKYTLSFFVAGEHTARDASEERDAANQVGNHWEFEVPELSTPSGETGSAGAE
jgi:hypothetical protein